MEGTDWRNGPTLVTGAGGFVGSWLVPELRQVGARVIGVRKPGVPSPTLDCEWIDADLADREAVDELVRGVAPRRILHLAAIAVPRAAAHDPMEALRVNYSAVDHLLEAIAAHAPAARILVVSTGDVYGRRPVAASPAREGDPPAPPNLYAATKAAAETRARLACERGLDVVLARPFNHTGPARPPDYAESAFASQLAQAERADPGTAPVVRVGNLEPLRDFSDVRDVAHAYRLLVERGRRGEVYNVCSGRARSIAWILDRLVERTRAEVRIEVDPDLYEPSRPAELASVGDPAKLRALGWTPRYRLETTLRELLDDWRARG